MGESAFLPGELSFWAGVSTLQAGELAFRICGSAGGALGLPFELWRSNLQR
jgi:hypothetical protein